MLWKKMKAETNRIIIMLLSSTLLSSFSLLTSIQQFLRILRFSTSCIIPLFTLLLILNISLISGKHHQIHSKNSCKEPIDLNWRLFRWFTEATKSEMFEIGDEDWIPPVPEPNFCSTDPVADINSTTMQRSLCPWQWKLNHDDNRIPKIISEAQCLCRRSRGSSASFCMPIKRQVAVLKRNRCDQTTGFYLYSRALQTITVGCHSVLPRSQKAKILTKLYRRNNNVDV